MNNLIFCPHTDDAIFSLGGYIIDNEHSFTIASAFAGIPIDEVGYKKHIKLRQEHDEACAMINAKSINGDLLDDVYGKQNEDILIDWIKNIIVNFDNIYIPLGIHHPDHVLLSDTIFNLMKDFNKTYFIYAELPYRILYPEFYESRIVKFTKKYKMNNVSTVFNGNKLNAIKLYDSQIQGDIVNSLMVLEKLWKIEND